MTQTGRPRRRRPREQIGGLAAALVGGGAFTAAALNDTGAGRVTGGIEVATATSATLLGEVATALPLGYAFGAGMVAAVNPCGFALLPAYLGLYLGAGEAAAMPRDGGAPLLRAIWISTVVTAGFMALFGVAGVILSVATATIARALPWLSLAIGVLLVLAGGRLLGGDTFHTTLAGRLANHLGVSARRPGSRGYLAYGVAYGLASLSCALPIFLTVVASTLTVDGVLAALLQYILYALGMGAVLTALTLTTAVFKHGALGRVRQVTRYLQPVSALLLLLAGAYIIYYWLTVGGLLARAGLR